MARNLSPMHHPPPPPSARSAPETALLGDGATLRDILALAGPALAPRLLDQIVADLATTSSQLDHALHSQNCPQIRAQSHVLISLAGTIGATGLHAAACQLNEAAHAQDTSRIAALAPAIAADLTDLIALVALQRATP